MANPTTNYSFVLPTSSDLVTDLPADFDVALQGVDTRLKALQPGTTLGDLAYSSATANTNTRLGIGSTGNVLTVTGGVPVWAAPAGGGKNYSLLNSGGTALSGASTTVSGISGKDSLIILVVKAESDDTSAFVTLRFNSNSSSVYGAAGPRYTIGSTYSAANFNDIGTIATTSIGLGGFSSDAASVFSSGTIIDGCNSAGVKVFSSVGSGDAGSGNGQQARIVNGIFDSSATISSVTVLTNTGTFNGGTMYIYGSA